MLNILCPLKVCNCELSVPSPLNCVERSTKPWSHSINTSFILAYFSHDSSTLVRHVACPAAHDCLVRFICCRKSFNGSPCQTSRREKGDNALSAPDATRYSGTTMAGLICRMGKPQELQPGYQADRQADKQT